MFFDKWYILIFVLKNKFFKKIKGSFCNFFYRIQGMKIGKNTKLSKSIVTWPHQICIGRNCTLEYGIYFKYDGPYRKGPSIIIKDHAFIGSNCEFNISGKIEIGSWAMIGSGCRFIDHDHGISIHEKMNNQKAIIKAIQIKDEVWLGVNVVVLKGITIGKGAVVAAGSVVTKDIPAYEVWGGIPASFIKRRE